jgi:deoxyribodipyrimidine photo-lyase
LIVLVDPALSMRTRFVWWVRTDMRLTDNPVLAQIAAHRGEKEIVPVYCFDPRHYGKTPYGNAKTGAYRCKFLLESVADLRSSLKSIGSDLLVGVGKPEELIPTLVAQRGENDAVPTTTTILCQEQVTSEEIRVDKALRSALPAGGACPRCWREIAKPLAALAMACHRPSASLATQLASPLLTTPS